MKLEQLRRTFEQYPEDMEARNALVRHLVRLGQHAEAARLLVDIDRKLEAARILERHGERNRACQLLHMRWRWDLDQIPPLYWGRERLQRDQIEDLIRDDRNEIDVVRLYTSFPRRGDGLPTKNRTFYLARYRAHLRHQRYRRLVLVAWTQGSASLVDHPEDRELNTPTITVELGIRTQKKKPWPRRLWTRGSLAEPDTER